MYYSIKKIRKNFPIINNRKDIIYLDNAASTYKPFCLIKSEIDTYNFKYSLYNKGIYSSIITKEVESSRKFISKFINSNYEEIVFTKGCTESINLIANSWGRKFLSYGDNIIISEIEHHSNIVPWIILSKEIGIKINILPIDKNGNLKLEILKKIINKKTKFCSFSHVSNILGIINNIEEIIYIIKKINKNIVILIDGSQSVSHLKIDVKKINCDFYVFSGHKIYGPLGIGILYGKKNILTKMNPWQVGGSIIKDINIKNNKVIFINSPWKFESGSINFASIIGLKHSIEFFKKIGIKKIFNWETKLVNFATNELKKIKNVVIFYESCLNKVCIISFNIKNIDSNDIGILLNNQNIFIRTGHQCSIPMINTLKIKNICRISFSMYTSLNEIKIFIKKLKFIINEYFKQR